MEQHHETTSYMQHIFKPQDNLWDSQGCLSHSLLILMTLECKTQFICSRWPLNYLNSQAHFINITSQICIWHLLENINQWKRKLEAFHWTNFEIKPWYFQNLRFVHVGSLKYFTCITSIGVWKRAAASFITFQCFVPGANPLTCPEMTVENKIKAIRCTNTKSHANLTVQITKGSMNILIARNQKIFC